MSDSSGPIDQTQPPTLSPLLTPTKHHRSTVFSMPSTPSSPTAGSIVLPPPSPLRPPRNGPPASPLLTLHLSNNHFLSNSHDHQNNNNNDSNIHNANSNDAQSSPSRTPTSVVGKNRPAKLEFFHHNQNNHINNNSPSMTNNNNTSPVTPNSFSRSTNSATTIVPQSQAQRSTPAFGSIDRTKSNSSILYDEEEPYHLYHEPLDPPEITNPTAAVCCSPPKSGKQCNRPSLLDDIVPPPLPSEAQSRPININQSSTMTRPNSNQFSGSATTSVSALNHSSDFQPFGPPPPISSVAGTHSVTNADVGLKKDVSEDIYHCYVTFSPHTRSSTISGARSSHHNHHHHQAQHRHGFVHGHKYCSNTLATVPSEHGMEQTSPGVGSATLSFNLPSAPVELRDHCIRELIETESNYVRALEMIINFFARPLERLIRAEDSHFVFNQIIQFHRIHKAFHAELLRACGLATSTPSSTPVPSQFQSLTEPNSSNKTVNNLASGTSPASTSTTISSQAGRPNSNPSTPTITVTHQFPSISSPGSSFRSAIHGNNSFDLHANSTCRLSECFLHWKDRFVMYGDYCANLSKAQALIDNLCNKNDQFNTMVQSCQHEANEGKFKLRDLLSLPMQRILKYHLLLAQLIKNTNEQHEDFIGLRRAHDTMVDLGKYINEVKRDSEAMLIINDIQSSIVDLDMPDNTHLTDYGRLVRDGELKTKSLDDTKIKSRYVFVFDKVMLMCKSLRNVRGEQHYCYKEAMILGEFDIDDAPSSADHLATIVRHPGKDKWSHYFNLVRRTDRFVYTFFAKTLESKNKWIEAINHAMDNICPAVCRAAVAATAAANSRNNSNNNWHSFLMHTFVKPTYCDVCGKLLHGLYYQGYRCKVCFVPAHKQCLGATRSCGTPSLSARAGACPSSPFNLATPSGKDTGQQFFSTSNVTRSCMSNGQRPALAVATVEYNNIDNGSAIDQHSPMRRPSSTITRASSSRTHGPSPPDSPSNVGKLASIPFKMKTSGRGLGAGIQLNSSVNVQEQNSANHLILQRSLLNGSKSSPAINHQVMTNANGGNSSAIRDCTSGDLKSASCDDEHQLNEQQQHSYGNVDSIGVLDQDHYVNFELNGYAWFSGLMDRDQAQSLLERQAHGTFLVRISPKQNGNYVISLNHNGQVKHMRIHVNEDNQLYLSQTRYFNSIIELVAWYQENSLVESFHLLDAKLLVPYKATD